jgi:hypothetical protein
VVGLNQVRTTATGTANPKVAQQRPTITGKSRPQKNTLCVF